jgi:MFS transporter, putative metabolite transport protein
MKQGDRMAQPPSLDTAIEEVAAQPAAAAPAPQRVTLDDIPVNAFHIKIAGLTFGAHFTEGYALGTIGYALASLNKQMPLDTFWTGMVGSSALIGIFLGSLIFGRLSDRMGRQRIFLLSFLIITAAAFAQFYVSSPLMLCVLRILIGIGMGGDFAVGHTFLAEFSPRKHRGTLLGSFSVIWTIGYVAASVLGIYYADATPDAWRWLLASAGVPALAVLVARIGTPESPRWLQSKGRIAEANATSAIPPPR